MKWIILICLLSSSYAKKTFNVGDGARYNLQFEDSSPLTLNIYISESSFTRLGVEYFFEDQLGMTKVWQQYVLGLKNQGPLSLLEGYIYSNSMKNPEKMTDQYLNLNEGVRLNDFLFQKKEELEPFKVKSELVEVPAGQVQATHYRKSRDGQIVDFWISPEAKPISLIKLNSKGKKKEQNYSLELKELLRDVKATIDSKKAVDLSEAGKSLLKK